MYLRRADTTASPPWRAGALRGLDSTRRIQGADMQRGLNQLAGLLAANLVHTAVGHIDPFTIDPLHGDACCAHK